MKIPFLIVAVAVTIFEDFTVAAQQNHALFVKNEVLRKGERTKRQTSADQMVQNILQWLQGVYTQNSRRIRQGTLREYLPPSNTQKPRPFEPINSGTDPIPFEPHPGYPPAGSITPQPPFPIYTNPTTGAVTGEGGYPSSPQPQPPYTGYPTTVYPQGPSTGYPTRRPPGFPSRTPPAYTTPQPSTGYTSDRPGFPSQPPPGYTPTGYPPSGFSTQPPTQQPSGYPTTTTQSPTFYPGQGSSTEVAITSRPGTSPSPTEHFTSPSITTQQPQNPTEIVATTTEDNNIIPGDTEGKGTGPESNTVVPPSAEDLKHPPHIHEINVECAKDMMTISIEFNREFNGIIYSKGHYNTPDCRYVTENSGQTKTQFTVSLNSCGTEFVNAFDTQGQSYLENVLVIQNEPGIQEVWDTIRSVRCLWEGNLKESLSVALSVGMLSQEIVTFSGDTAMAKLDIQMGKGPFAPSANGLVKIGEPMTLVVSVSGDPGFDIQVKDCRATDSAGDNIVPLTDDNGCVLKEKLFGAFQKTRNTGNTGASIIAYAFFNAFKFPDVMDLMIECNIELCKTDCQVCPNPNQKFEPARRRKRDLFDYYNNETLRGDGVTMGKHLRVILPQDLSDGNIIVDLSQTQGICMSNQNFLLLSILLVTTLTASCLISASLWLKNQHLRLKK